MVCLWHIAKKLKLLNSSTQASRKFHEFIQNLNFKLYYLTVWKFSNFPATLTLREINFGWFQKVKNCNFSNFEVWILLLEYNFILENVKIYQNSKFRAAKMIKIAVFGAIISPKMISRKIWMAVKSWNFHTVYLRPLLGKYVVAFHRIISTFFFGPSTSKFTVRASNHINKLFGCPSRSGMGTNQTTFS